MYMQIGIQTTCFEFRFSKPSDCNIAKDMPNICKMSTDECRKKKNKHLQIKLQLTNMAGYILYTCGAVTHGKSDIESAKAEVWYKV